jgi:hypothetical protein
MHETNILICYFVTACAECTHANCPTHRGRPKHRIQTTPTFHHSRSYPTKHVTTSLDDFYQNNSATTSFFSAHLVPSRYFENEHDTQCVSARRALIAKFGLQDPRNFDFREERRAAKVLSSHCTTCRIPIYNVIPYLSSRTSHNPHCSPIFPFTNTFKPKHDNFPREQVGP